MAYLIMASYGVLAKVLYQASIFYSYSDGGGQCCAKYAKYQNIQCVESWKWNGGQKSEKAIRELP